MPLGGSGSGTGASKASAGAVKAGEAFVEVSGDDSKLQRVLNGVIGKINAVGKVMMGVGLKSAAIMAAGLAPLVAMFKSAAEWGDSMTKASERMGATAEAASKLAYAAEQSDASLEDIVDANKKLTMSALAAADGQKEQAEAFKRLDIEAGEFLAMDADERFVLIASALEKIEDPLEQSQLLFALLGKSATKMLPLLRSGAEGLRDLYSEAARVGAVISNEDAASATRLGDTLDRTWKAVKMTFLEVGFALFGLEGALDASSGGMIAMLQNVRAWFRDNQGLIQSIGKVLATLLALSLAVTAFGFALSGAVTVIGLAVAAAKLLVAGVLALLTPIGLVTAAIVGLTVELLDDGPWQEFAETAMAAWEGIVAALKKGDLELAWKIVCATIKVIWIELMQFLEGKLEDFLSFFRNKWEDATDWLSIKLGDLGDWGSETADDIGDAFEFGWADLRDFFDDTGRGDRARAESAKARAAKIAWGDAARKKAEDDEKARLARQAREREAALAPYRDEIARLKADMNKLVARAVGRDEGLVDPMMPAEVGPMPRPAHSMLRALPAGDAVRGTFASRDYRGTLGIGPQSSIGKEQLDTQKEMLKELKEIRKKAGKPAFH